MKLPQVYERLLLYSSLATVLFSVPSMAVTLSGHVQIVKQNGDLLEDQSNVVVFLDGIKKPMTSPTTVQVIQRNKTFTPSVLPVVMGTTVDFPNEDQILHNVFSLSKAKSFDLGLYKQGQTKSVLFDKPGLIKVYCNIHEKMNLYVLVLENPYFALTDKNGAFQIQNVPQGKYQLTTWYRFSESQKKEVVISSEENIQVDYKLQKGDEIKLQLKETHLDEGHHNKWGKPYKDKY